MRNTFFCPACGWETKAPPHVLQVFHPCKPINTRRRLVRVPTVEVSREEAVRQVWEGFQSALPGEELLRRLDSGEEE